MVINIYCIMNRHVLITIAVLTASNSFAYYGDYSSSPDFELPGWVTFAGFLMIAWGILEIILFFKIWGMTNDVKAIKKEYLHDRNDESYYLMAKNLRKNLILGNIENVKKVLLTNFMDEIMRSYANLPSQGYEKDANGKDRLVSYEERNQKTPIAPYVENLRKQFEKIGEPLPTYINNMATYGDFLNIFTKEDLMMEK